MHRLDELDGEVGVHLLAEAGDVEVDRIQKAFIVVPHAFKDDVPCQGASFVAGKGLEEGEFSRRQVDLSAASPHHVPDRVDLQVGDKDETGLVDFVPTGERVNACNE